MAPSSRRLLFFVTLVVGVAVWLAFPRAASAQTITIVQATSLPRVNAKNEPVPKRALNLNPEGVSYQDCKDDQRIVYALQMSGFEVNANVEAWASVSGASCEQQTSRVGPTAVCWKLAASIPLSTINNVYLPVRTIMSGAGPGGATALDASENICGQVDLTTIVVQFLYFKPGQPAVPAVKVPSEIRVDTVGPPAVNVTGILPGNGRVVVQFAAVGTNSDAGGTGSSAGGVVEQAEIRVYCAPAETTSASPGTTTTVCNEVDASDPDAAPEDAGCTEVTTDGGASAAAACGSSAFVGADGQPVTPDAEFDAKYRCGRIIGPTGSSAAGETLNGQPLQNGTTYAVAVARTDGFGNGGALSEVLCETPEETTDFWAGYRNANGQGGGCATAGGGGSVAGAAITAFVVLAAGRRRRAREARR